MTFFIKNLDDFLHGRKYGINHTGRFDINSFQIKLFFFCLSGLQFGYDLNSHGGEKDLVENGENFENSSVSFFS